MVLAAHGYPDEPRKGDAIDGLPKPTDDCRVFHAGTRSDGKTIVTNGGRVLCVTALGDSVKMARTRAYEAVDAIRFDGMQYRKDIGHRALKRADECAAQVRDYFTGLQQRIVAALEALDGTPSARDAWKRAEGGGGVTRIIEEGKLFERGGVEFLARRRAATLPPSASAARPQLAGRACEAMGVSLVLHPRNPYCPTVHMNVRFFCRAGDASGGSAAAWTSRPTTASRRTRATSTPPAGTRSRRSAPSYYPRFKKWCDEYFYLKHRDEPRGIGGIFFDDLADRDFDAAFALMRSRRRSLPRRLRADRRATQATCPTASASATSRPTGAAATSSSTWSTTAARCSACSRAAAPSRS